MLLISFGLFKHPPSHLFQFQTAAYLSLLHPQVFVPVQILTNSGSRQLILAHIYLAVTVKDISASRMTGKW